MTVCKRCGTEFEQKGGRGAPRKYCSHACTRGYHAEERRAHNKDYPVRCCERCGREYKPVRADQKFCVKKCRGIADPFDCAHCQRTCVPGEDGVHIQARRFCSAECKDLWFRSAKSGRRRRARLQERVLRDLDSAGNEVRHWVAGPCAECGELFVGADHPWRPAAYCSQACAGQRFRRENPEKTKAYARAYRKRHPEKFFHQGKPYKRARHYGVAYEYVSPESIFERDGYRCGICGELTERDEVVPQPNAPTMDHIVPMSKGGPHLAVNIQCACFICNCRKGARMPEVQESAEMALAGATGGQGGGQITIFETRATGGGPHREKECFEPTPHTHAAT